MNARIRALCRSTVTACCVVAPACSDRSADAPAPQAEVAAARVGEHGGFPPTLLTREDLQRLVDAGLDRASAPLLDALADPDPAVRATAAYLFASVQDVAAQPRLVALLEDPDPATRRNAAFAIGQLGDAADATTLIAALHTETDPVVRLTLLEAAGRTGDADALARILTTAAPTGAESGTHVNIEPGRRASRDDAQGMALALYHFARRGVTDPAAAPVLLALLHADDARTRSTAALALAAPRADWGVDADDLRAALERLPADAREAGPLIRALARFGDAADLPRLLNRLEDRAHWTVRAAAASALAEYDAVFASAEAVAALRAALDDPSPHVATVAAGSLIALRARAGASRTATVDELDPGTWAEWIRAHPERPAVAAALLAGLVGTAHEPLVIEWASGRAASAARSLAWPALARSDAPETDTLLIAGLLGARRETYAAAAALADRLAGRPTDAPPRAGLAPVVARRLAVWGPHAPGSDVRGAQRLVRVLADAADADALLAAAAQHPHPLIRAAGAAQASRDAPPPARRSVNWSLLQSAGPRPCLAFTTARGSFTVELYPEVAPLAVSALLEWAAAGMYDGLTFHRVEPDFILQSGDYDSMRGYGGPERGLRSEFTQLRYAPGVLGIASSGRDTEGSQFFITHNYAPSLDGRYGAIGRVIAGQDIADRVALGDSLLAVSPAGSDTSGTGAGSTLCTSQQT